MGGSVGGLQLLESARSDDGRCHSLLVQEPAETDEGRLFPALATEGLVFLELRSRILDPLLEVGRRAPTPPLLLQRAAQDPRHQKTQRDEVQAVVTAGGQDLQRDVTGEEVQERLFAAPAARPIPAAGRYQRLRWRSANR